MDSNKDKMSVLRALQEVPTYTDLPRGVLSHPTPVEPLPPEESPSRDQSSSPLYDKLWAEMMEQRVDVRMEICPVVENKRADQPWYGVLWLRCNDLAQLMREGLHILSAGEIMVTQIRPQMWSMRGLPNESWTLRRYFSFLDAQKPPQWIATLRAHSDSVEALQDINIGALSFRNVVAANAWDKEGNAVYRFERWAPARAYNDILGDAPLDGWWPWPREVVLMTSPS
ncbi:hypothetical protein SCAR479_06475 [Seiridium cardinale]|uniref:Uncharacterized protein n=1 Tax=Seiridium cardinale TaxID=138064 RepID=A0ABR2XST3_9PEZI